MALPDYTNGPTYYPQGDFLGYAVYLDFGQLAAWPGLPTAAEIFRVFQIVAGALQPAGVTVTTRYPRKLRPGAFTRVVFDPQPTLGWRDAGGNCPVKQLRNPSWYTPCNVYVGWSGAERSGWVAAHEAVHSITSLDLGHDDAAKLPDGTPNLMAGTGPANSRLSPRFVADIRDAVKKFLSGVRMAAHVGADHRWTMDWTNIGK
jgi:hypothetical protein